MKPSIGEEETWVQLPAVPSSPWFDPVILSQVKTTDDPEKLSTLRGLISLHKHKQFAFLNH